MRWPTLVYCFLALLGWEAGAHAASADAAATDAPVLNPANAEHEAFTTAPAVRRSGFSFGVSGGLMLASVSGYPNEVSKIGLPEFEAETGLGTSAGGALWLGGALTDWLSVGIGTFGGGFSADGLRASGAAFQFRIESFPMFYQHGAWQDVGLLFTAGTGGYTLKRGTETVAEGSGTSAVGLGVFFERWRFWQFSTGPQLEYAHHFSRSLSAHSLVIGWRAAFYGGP
jgi:hypothetical protein